MDFRHFEEAYELEA